MFVYVFNGFVCATVRVCVRACSVRACIRLCVRVCLRVQKCVLASCRRTLAFLQVRWLTLPVLSPQGTNGAKGDRGDSGMTGAEGPSVRVLLSNASS